MPPARPSLLSPVQRDPLDVLPRARISVSPEHPSFHPNTQASLSRAHREGPRSLAVLGRAGEEGLKPLRLSWDQPVPCSECQSCEEVLGTGWGG